MDEVIGGEVGGGVYLYWGGWWTEAFVQSVKRPSG